MSDDILISKIEDLNRMILGMRKKKSGVNLLEFCVLSGGSFTSDITLGGGGFKVNSDGTVNASVSFTLDAPVDTDMTIKAYLNGAETDAKMFSVKSGCRGYAVNFATFAAEGEYRISFRIFCGDSSVKEITDCWCDVGGDVDYLNDKGKIAAFEDYYNKFACCDRDYIYQKIIYNGEIYLMARFINRGDFTFSSCHNGSDDFDTVMAYCDEGKLFLLFTPYHSDFPIYKILADENVTKVTSAKCISPGGCAVFYIKDSSVYFMLLQKSVEDGKIHISFKIKTEYCPLARDITAVQLPQGFGYILSEKPRKNTLKLFKGDFLQCPRETAAARARFWIEGLA